jgi:signal transduction histidine kinase
VEQVLPALAHDTKASNALGVVNEQVQRIQHTIRGLLDLARSNQPSLARSAPEAVVRSALRAVMHRFERGGVEVRLRLAEDLPPISCDAPILEQALVNLLLNALEASEDAEHVALSVHADDSNVVIAVEDEGHGITDEAVEHAGEPFYTTKGKHRGTGLGLAIAQEIIASHGGKLTLARRTDRPGTRATIELPRA